MMHEEFQRARDGSQRDFGEGSDLSEFGGLFSVEAGLKDMKYIPRFLDVLKLARTWERRCQLVQVILRSAPAIIEKFTATRGLRILCDFMSSALTQYQNGGREYVALLTDLLGQMTASRDLFLKSKVDVAVNELEAFLRGLDSRVEEDERTNKKLFRILTKWKPILDEFKEQLKERRVKKKDSPSPQRAQKRVKESDERDRRQSRHHRSRSPHDHGQKTRDGRRSSRRRGVVWREDELLTRIKFFRSSDEPSAPALSPEEVEAIQRKMIEDPKLALHHTEDYKHKESRWEAESLRSKKDDEHRMQMLLDDMIETMKWERPRRLFQFQIKEIAGRASIERQLHEQRISQKLSCLYAKESQIPEAPMIDNLLNVREAMREPERIPLRDSSRDEGRSDIMSAVMVGGVSEIDSERRSGTEPQRFETIIRVRRDERPVRGILRKTYDDRQEKDAKIGEMKRQERQFSAEEIAKTMEMLMQAASIIDDGERTRRLTELNERLAAMNLGPEEMKDLLNRVNLIKSVYEQRMVPPPVQPGPKPPQMSAPRFDPINKTVTTEPTIDVSNQTAQIQSSRPPQAAVMPSFQSNQSRSTSYPQSTSPGGGGGNGSGRKQIFRPNNYKTVPCRLFHSPLGCERGEGCHFIHDYNFAGRETPNMQKYVRPLNKLSKNEDRNKELVVRLSETQKPSGPEGNYPNPAFQPNAGGMPPYYGYPPDYSGARQGGSMPMPYGFHPPPDVHTSQPGFPKGVYYPGICLLYTSPSPRDRQKSRMPSSA
eukprot:TRINITY_DN19583_c0_g1_i1.p1 TRINITY_DN19583_c0_g1~~TRINITY_DN19583_c0_g1_i1.p1  ORF type:complete len:768 (-),score=136.94 TRINITY_DN19583_c0_g1_i1:11-2314(-)